MTQKSRETAKNKVGKEATFAPQINKESNEIAVTLMKKYWGNAPSSPSKTAPKTQSASKTRDQVLQKSKAVSEELKSPNANSNAQATANQSSGKTIKNFDTVMEAVQEIDEDADDSKVQGPIEIATGEAVVPLKLIDEEIDSVG